MIRNIISIILSVIVAVIVFIINEHFLHQQFPLSPKLDLNNNESLALFIEMMPISAFIMVYAGWVIGSILAGTTIKFVSNENNIRNPIISGIILTLFGAYNFYLVPHPLWFVIISVISFIPCVLLGYGFFKIKSN